MSRPLARCLGVAGLVGIMQVAACGDGNAPSPHSSHDAARSTKTAEGPPRSPAPQTPPSLRSSPTTTAWPLLPPDFSSAPPLATAARLGLRARPGAVVRTMRAGTVTAIRTVPAATRSHLSNVREGSLDVEVRSAEGLRVQYQGLHEALVREGVRLHAGATLGRMHPRVATVLSLEARRGNRPVPPLALLGR